MSSKSTSTQLAARGNGAALAQSVAPNEWTREYLDVLKATYAKKTTDAEFALAVQVSKATGLRIDTHELWVYKRGDNDPVTISISIDGFRAIAHASGTYAGEEGPLWCGPDGAWVDVWLKKEPPIAAKFTVWRADIPRPFPAVVLLSEFRTTSPLWTKSPVYMSGVRAASHAFRKAWRQEIAMRQLQAERFGARLEVSAAEPDYSPRVVDQQTGEILDAEVVPLDAAPAQEEPQETLITIVPAPANPSASTAPEPAWNEPVVTPGEGARTLAEIWLGDMDRFGGDELLSETFARYVMTCHVAAKHRIYGFKQLALDADEETIKAAGNRLWRMLPQAVRDEATKELNG